VESLLELDTQLDDFEASAPLMVLFSYFFLLIYAALQLPLEMFSCSPMELTSSTTGYKSTITMLSYFMSRPISFTQKCTKTANAFSKQT